MTSARVLYVSTDRTGAKIAVSGTVLVPKTPWIGIGKRPVIGYAAGTQGLADRCAPSRMQSEGLEYESLFIKGLIERGMPWPSPDYQGLGTAGVHTYMNRVAQGAPYWTRLRAAQRLSGSGLSSLNPVGLVGYSQGGGASAAAAELAASYAPELKVKGAVAGAVPADLGAVATNLDGGLYAEFALYGVRGVAAGYGIDLHPYFNATGRQVMDEVEGECVTDLFNHAFVSSKTLTNDGSSFAQMLNKAPFAAIVAEQKIGTIKPAMPVLVTHSVLDDVIPFTVGKTMAKSWCAARARNVYFSPNATPRAHRRDAEQLGRAVRLLRGPLRRPSPALELLGAVRPGDRRGPRGYCVRVETRPLESARADRATVERSELGCSQRPRLCERSEPPSLTRCRGRRRGGCPGQHRRCPGRGGGSP
jgi:hypothetical protein